MKSVKMILMTGFVLFMTTISAMDDSAEKTAAPQSIVEQQVAVQPVVGQQKIDDVQAKFESLLQEALNANSPSVAKRLGMGATRELIKILGPFLMLIIGNFFEKDKLSWHNWHNLATDLFLLLASVVPCLSDHFIGAKDQLLVALKKIEKNISEIYPEQRSRVVAQFGEKIKDLTTKVLQQKNDFEIKVEDFYFTFDILLLIFVYNCLSSQKPEGFFDTFDSKKELPCTAFFYMAIILILVTDLPQIINNFWHNPDSEKTAVLARIQKALAI